MEGNPQASTKTQKLLNAKLSNAGSTKSSDPTAHRRPNATRPGISNSNCCLQLLPLTDRARLQGTVEQTEDADDGQREAEDHHFFRHKAAPSFHLGVLKGKIDLQIIFRMMVFSTFALF